MLPKWIGMLSLCQSTGQCVKDSCKCYISAYRKTGASSTPQDYYWPSISGDSSKVHLLARIFLGSVCLIWSGLSQLGFLTGNGSNPRWNQSSLHEIKEGATAGLGSFMAAMGYDLDRLNQEGSGKKGEFVQKLLNGEHPNGKDGIKWHEFKNGTDNKSVAEYYSSIYGSAKTAAKTAAEKKSTESICKEYPLLVLHILASGYFRAGSAGAKNITSAPKAPSSDPTKPRHPRTIREILYWLSALPYSQGYRELVERMQGKFPEDDKKNGQLQLHGESQSSTTLLRKDITHYLLAACGYCPLVLIGIQGTIEKEVDKTPGGAGGSGSAGASTADKKQCPNHSKDPKSKRCKPNDIDKTTDTQAQSTTTGKPLEKGQVCYRGYHLEVKDFGPLHGMYANGLYGFDMDLSAAQCLDQLRVYVYHCFYQLYFLRKQCGAGVTVDKKAVLGWNSCRYGKDVKLSSGTWLCSASSTGSGSNGNCNCKEIAGHSSPLMAFLCDSATGLHCPTTTGRIPDRKNDPYPEIIDHMDAKETIGPKHFEVPQHCPVPMGWQAESTSHRSTTGTAQEQANHFKDLTNGTHKTLELQSSGTDKYPAHCTGNTLSLLLEYYCDPEKCHGTLVLVLRLLACITPTVPRTLGDLFGFYYYIVYIGGQKSAGGQEVHEKLDKELKDVRLSMLGSGPDAVVKALGEWNNGKDCSTKNDTLKCLVDCSKGSPYLSPLSGQQYGQLSPAMAGTYLSWLVYLIGEFQGGLKSLQEAFKDIQCKLDGCQGVPGGAGGCDGSGQCQAGTHGGKSVCCCDSVVSCTGVLPVLYKYGFGYGDVSKLHKPAECICGLAAAVTDLLQSVELEYNGYEGEATGKGATQQDVTNRLNELFSLVQGLGGTAVVRTYIDQLAQVLSALVGWSRIETCGGKGECKGTDGDASPHGQSGSGGGRNGCKYLDPVQENTPCTECKCMKWEVPAADKYDKGHHLGRGCTKCKDSGGTQCSCGTGGCQGGPRKECKCALAGKCCKCCCKGCTGKCKQVADRLCTCDGYRSAYPHTSKLLSISFVEDRRIEVRPYWKDLTDPRGYYPGSASSRRHHCARILLGSVCLIWSGITYMYWTGKYAKGSPRWNNHILDGSGLDDGTLSQWLQALGFPREMLNNSGPQNRLDKVIWNGISDKLLLGFAKPSGATGYDTEGNTARNPAGMNYAGLVHTIHRDSFNEQAIVFNNGTTSGNTDIYQHKRGALYKLYIISCAYFTGLQKKNTHSTPRTPKTIREILYWLSALPYSQAYKKMLTYGKERLKEVLKKPGETESSSAKETQLKFYQDKRPHPITVDEYNLFAHFQAVTQYCPLVLIGIQGGIHSTTKGTDSTKEPAIHALYANTECHFTYPTVSIQAYNQVVHYIRALFYQLYFLRKQCAVKVALGGKWRECRYGKDVVSKGVISWMCLGCSPMEHDRKKRVDKVKEELGKVVKKVKLLEGEKADGIEKAKALLVAIGDVVVQLGNAQEALERKAENKAIEGVKQKLTEAKGELEGAKEKLDEAVKKGMGGLMDGMGGLDVLDGKLGELTGNGGGSSGILKDLEGKLDTATGGKEVDPGKNEISKAIHKVWEVLKEMEKQLKEVLKNIKDEIEQYESDMDDNTGRIIQEKTFYKAVKELISICNSPKCPSCKSHSTKCGREGQKRTCDKCHQQYMDGFPSPFQAFLEDRLPGFSCQEILYTEDADKYPPAASHLWHSNGTGQCCPVPMGFRGNFCKGSTSDMTGSRLYGILYFFSNGDMMQSCVYTLVRVTAELSATTPQVLGDVFGFFRGGVGEKEKGMTKNSGEKACDHSKDPSNKGDNDYFCGWCASGLRDEVKKIEWIPKGGDKDKGGQYRKTVGTALIDIKGDKGSGNTGYSNPSSTSSNLSTLTSPYLSPLTGELYTAVSATFGGTYLSWVLYLSDSLYWGLESLASEFKQIECRGCKGQCDPNKCKKGSHGDQGGGQCLCQSVVSCTGVLPVLYRHGFSYGNPFNLEGYQQEKKDQGDYSIEKTKNGEKHCHQFLDSLQKVIEITEKGRQDQHPLSNLLSQVGQLQYDIRLPWIFVLTISWLVAVLYLAFGAI